MYVDITNFAVSKAWTRNGFDEYTLIFNRDVTAEPLIGFQGEPLGDALILEQMIDAAGDNPDDWEGFRKLANYDALAAEYLQKHRDSIMCPLRTRPISADDTW